MATIVTDQQAEQQATKGLALLWNTPFSTRPFFPSPSKERDRQGVYSGFHLQDDGKERKVQQREASTVWFVERLQRHGQGLWDSRERSAPWRPGHAPRKESMDFLLCSKENFRQSISDLVLFSKLSAILITLLLSHQHWLSTSYTALGIILHTC